MALKVMAFLVGGHKVFGVSFNHTKSWLISQRARAILCILQSYPAHSMLSSPDVHCLRERQPPIQPHSMLSSTYIHCLSKCQSLGERTQTFLSRRGLVVLSKITTWRRTTIAEAVTILASIINSLTIVGEWSPSSVRASTLRPPTPCRRADLIKLSSRAPTARPLSRISHVISSIIRDIRVY